VDTNTIATAVPNAKRSGKLRKILFLFFLALAGSSKIPTVAAAAVGPKKRGAV
jgi:hypothetical protein